MSDGERESAERFFIRYYQDRPEEELPQRYPGVQCLFLIITIIMDWTYRYYPKNLKIK